MISHDDAKLYEKDHDALELQYCPNCEKYIFYPRELCPYCLEAKPQWKKASGRGEIYSYTVVRKSALKEFDRKVPYIYAIVELDEGVRIPTTIVGCPIDEVKIGMPVEYAGKIGAAIMMKR
jgi:uncharacterized protein